MKVRIKATGEIIKAAEYAKITLDVCDSYGNPIEVKLEEVELIQDNKEDTSIIDYNQIRVQASIAAMQAILTRINYCTCENIVKHAVKYADTLIKKLKKK